VEFCIAKSEKEYRVLGSVDVFTDTNIYFSKPFVQVCLVGRAFHLSLAKCFALLNTYYHNQGVVMRSRDVQRQADGSGANPWRLSSLNFPLKEI